MKYRANYDALKAAGATQILGSSAVASPVQHIEPGDLAIPSQYVDCTQGRARAQLHRRRRGGACLHGPAGQRSAVSGQRSHDRRVCRAKPPRWASRFTFESYGKGLAGSAHRGLWALCHATA